MTADVPGWDLDTLYAGVSDPSLAEDIGQLRVRSKQFRDRYFGGVPGLSGRELREAIEDYELVIGQLETVEMYVGMSRRADANDAAIGQAAVNVGHLRSDVEQATAFFCAELQQDAARLLSLASHPELARYETWLEGQANAAAHSLNPEVEAALAFKGTTGADSWRRFHFATTSQMRFEIGLERQQIGPVELRNAKLDADRDIREAARDAESRTLASASPIVGTILSNLFEDARRDALLRGHESALAATAARNRLTIDVYQALDEAISRNLDLFHTRHCQRAAALSLSDYALHDSQVPLASPSRDFGWTETCDLVIEANAQMAPELAVETQMLLQRSAVDPFPRSNKSAHEVSWSVAGSAGPYVLLNHSGGLADALLAAHELGHALQFHRSKAQTHVNYFPGFGLVEVASNVGERLMEAELVRRTRDPEAKSAMRTALFDRNLGNLQSTIIAHRFEGRATTLGAEGQLSAHQMADLWLEVSSEVLGEAVHLRPSNGWDWVRCGHFAMESFYLVNYILCHLLSVLIQKRRMQEGPDFGHAYLNFLSAGGSLDPADLIGALGIDLKSTRMFDEAFENVRGEVEGVAVEHSGRA